MGWVDIEVWGGAGLRGWGKWEVVVVGGCVPLFFGEGRDHSSRKYGSAPLAIIS